MVDDAAATAVLATDADDLLTLAAALIAVPSPSLGESRLADLLERRLRARAPNLTLARVGDNLVVRTDLGRSRRILLGGHLDTVPADGNATPEIDRDVLRGLGAADMKGALAGLLRIAEQASAEPDRLRSDLTIVCYAGEEIADEHNGLRTLFAEAPGLLDADLAIMLEPTDGWVEAGCQGTTHVRATYRGVRAHSARPWSGENAIHRAAAALTRVAAAAADVPEVTVDGLGFRQALQVVAVHGGVANNVVPDECQVTVNRRFAPSFTSAEVRDELAELLGDADDLEFLNESPGALPGLKLPVVAEFVGTLDLAVRPKFGWTDVARFTEHGIPALNFGPGDPQLAHHPDEHVTRQSLDGAYRVLAWFLGLIPGPDGSFAPPVAPVPDRG